MKNAGRYDNYDRKGIKVFADEYAAHAKESEGPVSNILIFDTLQEKHF
jgi:alpha-N-arabinofuranosidase